MSKPKVVLKSCLYCGKSDALKIEEAAICFKKDGPVGTFGRAVVCYNCGCRGPVKRSDALARLFWNDRDRSICTLIETMRRYKFVVDIHAECDCSMVEGQGGEYVTMNDVEDMLANISDSILNI